MHPGEAFNMGAQVAVALAGFAGVVVVFRNGSVHDSRDSFLFRHTLVKSDGTIAPLSSHPPRWSYGKYN
jgi:hypothetical protein